MESSVKRVLAISWAMPPMLAPRALQVSRLLKGLRAFGWESTVICADPVRDIAGITFDAELAAAYEGAYEVAVVPYGQLLDSAWVAEAVRVALDVLEVGHYRAILTFAQPWFDHLVGLQLKKATGLPWIAHFSDPWVDSPYYGGLDAATRTEWTAQEAETVRAADLVVFTTEETARLVMAKYPPAWQAKARVVPHGFSRALLVGMEQKRSEGLLRIVYAGDFYEGKRTPTTLLRAFKMLAVRNEWAGKVVLLLVGSVPTPHISEIEALGLSSQVQVLGRRPYMETLALTATADILVVVDAKADLNVFLPSKAVDYLAFRKMIVGLTPAEGATASLLHRAGFRTVEPDDVDGAAALLHETLSRCVAPEPVLPKNFDAVAEQYDINYVSQQFSILIEEALNIRQSINSEKNHHGLDMATNDIEGVRGHCEAKDAWGGLMCPTHQIPLTYSQAKGNPAASGHYLCVQGCSFPEVNGIPRFVPSESYASSFGWQWRNFAKTQLDSHTGLHISRDRLQRCLGGSFEAVKDKLVLEAGCGAGRFSEVLLDEGARLFSCDISSAVEASSINHNGKSNYFLCQGNIYTLPVAPGTFDVVVCIGVIQHTPSPEETISKLVSYLKPGGLLVIDHYSLEYEYTKPRQIFRNIVLRLPPQLGSWLTIGLSKLLLAYHRRYWDYSASSARRRDFLNKYSPLVDYFTAYPQLPLPILEAWCILDTHDTITDVYKHLRSPEQIKAVLEALGLESVVAYRGGNGVEARARRPL